MVIEAILFIVYSLILLYFVQSEYAKHKRRMQIKYQIDQLRIKQLDCQELKNVLHRELDNLLK